MPAHRFTSMKQLRAMKHSSLLSAIALLMASAPQVTRATTVVRTLTYDQITTTCAGASHSTGGGTPIISRNGNAILFAKAGSPSQVFRINADGTGLAVVGS